MTNEELEGLLTNRTPIAIPYFDGVYFDGVELLIQPDTLTVEQVLPAVKNFS